MLISKTKDVEVHLTEKMPAIFTEGWDAIINLNFNEELVPPYSYDSFKYVLLKFHGVEAAVMSFYINDAIKGREIVVDMAYVDPRYRYKGFYKFMHKLLLKYAKSHKIKLVSITVKANNKLMIQIQKQLKGDPQYTTFEYRP